MKHGINYIGSKKRLSDKIIAHFPRHSVYVEPFFGGGGVFFNKPLVPINRLNDINGELIDFYLDLIANYNQYMQLMEIIPMLYVDDQLISNVTDRFTRNFLRLLMRFNASLFPQSRSVSKSMIIDRINHMHKYLSNARLYNMDALAFLRQQLKNDLDGYLIYCDPPYINTINEYGSRWTIDHLKELLNTLRGVDCPYFISEFASEEILKLSRDYQIDIHHTTEGRLYQVSQGKHSRN